MSNSFWNNEVTTVSTFDAYRYRQNDLVTITYPANSDTTGTTAPVKVLYRVKAVSTFRVVVTPIHAQRLAEEESWFPSRWEINREAAIAGGRAQQKKHSRIPKNALGRRSSFQGMARLPCYRGTRTR